jgi:8-oxo-dGTP diphosphatase
MERVKRKGPPMTPESPRHIVVVSSLIRDVHDQILLVRHHRRGWEIPQGRVEEGESLMAALHREVLEETGVSIEPGPLACVWSKLSSPPALVFTFICHYLSGEPTPCDECPEVGWFPPAESLARVTHPVNRDRLQTLLDFHGTTVYRAYDTNPYRVIGEGAAANRP